MLKFISKSMKKQPFKWFIIGIMLGIIISSIINYFFGIITKGHLCLNSNCSSYIYNNGTGIIISGG